MEDSAVCVAYSGFSAKFFASASALALLSNPLGGI
jgi:hypothetical protein